MVPMGCREPWLRAINAFGEEVRRLQLLRVERSLVELGSPHFYKLGYFTDGNKRIAAHAVLTFLRGNGIEIDCTEFELFSLSYKLAASEVTFDALTDWLKTFSA